MLRLGWIKPREATRCYLDHAAATPLRPEIRRLMDKTARELYGNPSAIHREGVVAREQIEASRLALARTLKIRPEGIVFTGSGTESNNLALNGLVRQLHQSGRTYESMTVISTQIEHPSISAVLDYLSELGVNVTFVPVSEAGVIDLDALSTHLDDSVILVTCAYVNSEIGTIQPITRIARLLKQYNHSHEATIRLHVDAAQAPLWLPCQLDGLGADLLSLDAGKCYGPKGVGFLAFRHGVSLAPVMLGGGQEFGLRSATENTPGVVGAVEAFGTAQAQWESRSATAVALRDSLIEALQAIDGLVLNGSREHRVANNVNVSIPGIDGEFAVVTLDEAGIAVSTRSACSGAGGAASSVVETISGDAARATATIRITIGEDTTKAELDRLVQVLRSHVKLTREAQARLTQ